MQQRPERALHVLHSLATGGKERVVLDLARRSRAAGFDDRVLLFDQAAWSDGDFDPGNIPVEFALRRRGVDLGCAKRIADKVADLRTDIVHAHNDTALFYAALAIRRLRSKRRRSPRPRLVATYHNLPTHPGWRARLAARWAARSASVLVAVSRELHRTLIDTGWITRAEVICNGVDTAVFSAAPATDAWRHRLRIDDQSLMICNVARLAPVKRQSDLIQAMQILRTAGVRSDLVLVGSGPDHDQLQQQAAGAVDIHFVPRVEDVTAFLREVDVFVLCSDHEGTPMALLEAMACARAAIGTAVGGIPELLGHGAGLLVPARNPDALAQAIESLLDPEVRRSLGRRARQHVLSTHDAAEVWKRYEGLYGRA